LPLYHEKNGIYEEPLYEFEIYDDDDYEAYSDEEEEEDAIPEVHAKWGSEEDFGKFVYEEASKNKRHVENCLKKEDFYFNMIQTEEFDKCLERTVTVWWLPRDHPYACMIKEANINYYSETKKYKYPRFSSHLGMVIYQDFCIEQAVVSTMKMCARHGLEVELPDTEAKEEESNKKDD
jgi:hypothetical protein